MIAFKKHLIRETEALKKALEQLNSVPENLTLFALNENGQLTGTITDGDIRRALLAGKSISDPVTEVMFRNFRFLRKSGFTYEQVQEIKSRKISLVPVLDEENYIDRLINFDQVKTILPLDVVIMAGGRGERLRPLTDETPKSLLPVGNKPILEHNIDRLSRYGVNNFIITIRHLADKIMQQFGNGDDKGIDITYIRENLPMGTIGSVSMIEEFTHRHVLITNSDLLTTIDYEDFYRRFIDEDADMAVASAPYNVDLPYAILETRGSNIISFREKPTYTYYSNAGIYLVKRELLSHIPVERSFNTTDFMQVLLGLGKKIIYYPILGYWLDIGRHEDYIKANEDIAHLKMD
jgi:dTDP-glucose pyrophosphorylase